MSFLNQYHSIRDRAFPLLGQFAPGATVKFLGVAIPVFNRGVPLSRCRSLASPSSSAFLSCCGLRLRSAKVPVVGWCRRLAITNYSAGQFGRRFFVCF